MSKNENKNIKYTNIGYFKVGNLYTFNGKYRFIYPSMKYKYGEIPHTKNKYKIVSGDKIIFLDMHLRKDAMYGKKTFWHKGGKHTEKKLKNMAIEAFNICNKNEKCYSIKAIKKFDYLTLWKVNYKNSVVTYSGRMRVGYKDLFGWINIKKYTINDIKNLFLEV